MSNLEIRFDEPAMTRAIIAYQNAANDYQAMIQQLNLVAESLSKRSLVGETGLAAERYIQQLVLRLNAHRAKADEMARDIRASLNQMLGNVDPSVGSTFTDNA